MLLPARMAVLNYLNKVKDASVEEIMTAMKPQYGREGQFTKKMHLNHAMALEANGMCDLAGYELDKNGELLMRFAINEAGRDAVNKYVPAKFR
uniref:hypothetical protein n=1 Tax=Enterocloster clostridioformis TaxID=1531 RepID=UPI001C3DBEBB|nr:hypothetical protein [Enterocloster clostridioformis]